MVRVYGSSNRETRETTGERIKTASEIVKEFDNLNLFMKMNNRID